MLERELDEQPVEPGDHERFAHYVRKEKILESALSGEPVVALCGKVWVPGRDPNKFPVCPTCKEIYQSIGARRGRRGQRLSPARSPARAPGPLSATYRGATFGIVAVVTLVAFEAIAVATAMPVAAARPRRRAAVRARLLAVRHRDAARRRAWPAAGATPPARGSRRRSGSCCSAPARSGAGSPAAIRCCWPGGSRAGLGGGLLVVALFVIMAAIYPSELQPRVFAMISAAWVLPAVIGPALAGWLAAALSWRAVFLLVVPLALLPAMALLPRLRRTGPLAGGSAGTGGIGGWRSRAVRGVLAAVGIAGLQWGLQEVGPDRRARRGGAWVRCSPAASVPRTAAGRHPAAGPRPADRGRAARDVRRGVLRRARRSSR